MKIIDKPERAMYEGRVVTIIGKRWPARYETGMRYDVRLPDGEILRDVEKLDFKIYQ